MTEDDLDPIPPAEALPLYLDHREPEVSEKTLLNHEYRLETFCEFCGEFGIETLDELSPRDIHQFRSWRRREGNVATITLRGELATLRVFLEFCADLNFVPEGMRERVKLPSIDRSDEARDVKLPADRAEDILQYMERYEYASRDHVIVAILWHTGIRMGALRALDVDDFDQEAQCLDLRHRPESGTPLKNGEAAGRSIAVGDYYTGVLQDYLQNNRHSITDDDGRRPLISSTHGRLSPTGIRDTIYRWSRPCQVGKDCPHDRDVEECEAINPKAASKCPSSRSPHGVRRGAITHHLRTGTPERVVSDRMNVSSDVLDQHYDRRTDREKMELRRGHLPDS
ncbi:tyrosine-type recombinase/integrase [Salinarchaeum chitinilyticum]